MNAADVIGFFVALALALAAVAFVLHGFKAATYAYTLMRVTHLQKRLTDTADVVLAAHDARIDGVTARTESNARFLAALLQDLGEMFAMPRSTDANRTGPGDSTSPGPCDQSSPPAASPGEERQA